MSLFETSPEGEKEEAPAFLEACDSFRAGRSSLPGTRPFRRPICVPPSATSRRGTRNARKNSVADAWQSSPNNRRQSECWRC